MNAQPKAGEFNLRERPVNVEAEQAVLGAILLDNTVMKRVDGLVAPDDFSEPLHSQIFAMAEQMIAAGKLVTPITLKSFIADHDLGGVTASQYLASICGETPSIREVPGYARLVADLHRRRKMIDAADHLMNIAYDAPLDASPAALASQAITGLQEIAGSGDGMQTRVNAGAAAADLLNRAEAIRRGEIEIDACPSGFDDIDRKTGGYEAGLLWVIGARPSMGKTTHMFSSARRTARKGHGVLVFSLEDDEPNAIARMLADAAYSQRTAIPYGSIYRGKDLTDDDIWRLREVQAGLADIPLVCDFASNPTTDQIAVKIRAEKERMAKRGQRLRVVFIDYLSKIRMPDRYRGNANKEFGEVTSRLKNIARDEQLCVVLYSQLNRANETQADKRPTLISLRDSGEIEQDANVVAFLHRESYYRERAPEYAKGEPDAVSNFQAVENEVEFIVAKNKAGPIGTVKLWCNMASSSMANAGRV